MHGRGIVGALWSAVRRLASAPGGIRATIAAVGAAAMVAGAPMANASVEYTYTGGYFTTVTGVYTTSERVTGNVIFSNPLTPSAANDFLPIQDTTSPKPFSFTFTDGVNTVSSAAVGAVTSGSIVEFDTNAADQIVSANLGVGILTYQPSLMSYGIEAFNQSSIGSSSASPNGSGRGVSSAGGAWSGPMAVATPGPSLYLTVDTAGPNSVPTTAFPAGQPTSINASLTLATAAPAASSLLIPVTLPSTATTLQEAATDLGYASFNWVQTVTIPSPSRAFECGSVTSCLPANWINITGTTEDPPANGWAYLAGQPSGSSYPFYCGSSNFSPGGVCAETSTVLGFVDQPSDVCIAGPNGAPSQAYTAESMALGSNACGSTLFGLLPRLASGAQMFSTELVGVKNSYVSGNSCDPTTCVDLGGFTWDDNFNGSANAPGTGTGGATLDFTITKSNFPLDVGSGTGGITVLSENVGTVPEPPSGMLLLTFLPILLGGKWLRRVY